MIVIVVVVVFVVVAVVVVGYPGALGESRAPRRADGAMMQEHKSFLIRDLLGDVLADRVQGTCCRDSCSGRSRVDLFHFDASPVPINLNARVLFLSPSFSYEYTYIYL